MSSIICCFLRPLPLFPSILPSSIVCSRPSCRSMWPNHLCFLWCILSIRVISSGVQHLLIWHFLYPANVWNFSPYPNFKRACKFLRWFYVIVHVSAPYSAMLHTVSRSTPCISLFFSSIPGPFCLSVKFSFVMNAFFPIAILLFKSCSHYPSSVRDLLLFKSCSHYPSSVRDLLLRPYCFVVWKSNRIDQAAPNFHSIVLAHCCFSHHA